MMTDFDHMLLCPACTGNVQLAEAEYEGGHVKNGVLSCVGCGNAYPIREFIPRFVPSQDYTNSFGFQWNRFAKTQLDSHSGHPISRERFFRTTGWTTEEMKGKLVLDLGCGAGRFAEIALSTGAKVVALDYSNAVNACHNNLFPHRDLEIVQADIYHLPFKPSQFDFVYCLGVLQHTPDVHTAFSILPKMLRVGGKLAVDVYPKTFLNIFFSKYWLRPITRRLAPSRLFAFCERLVDLFSPISSTIGKIPVVGKKMRYLIPVVNYESVYPLSPQKMREWVVLDTFDMLAPKYDQPQTMSTLRRWFAEMGLKNVEVFRQGALVGRGSVLE